MKWLLLLVMGLSLSGCSTFKKEWRAAIQSPTPANSIEGPWVGEWRSEKNGHHGLLRCVVSKTSETTYRAHYRAKFWKIFRYTYAATLEGRETNGAVTLEGQTDLGIFAGGVYTYKGTVTPTDFRSTYACKWDHGNYRMSRPSR